MFRAVFAHLCRGVVVLVVATGGLLWNATESRAAGCHVPYRPVLGGKLSWENKLVSDLNPAAPALAPPVLAHPPCEGESPRLLETAGAAPAAVCRQQISPDSPRRSGELTDRSSTHHSQPPAFRLDRPPRVIAP